MARRTLSQTYDANGNLKTKTSSVGADIGVSAYGYDASKPHRLASATIGGKAHAFSHDADGNITKYDCTSSTCGDDKYIDWNGRNLPERITVGGSRTDATPTARDEFAYGPDGARYHRKTSYMDGETLRAENTYYVGAFEELLPRPGAAHTSIRQTRVTDSVRHVKTTAVRTTNGKKETVTASYVDYLHKDHLGSVEGVTGANGARTRELAYDPFGGRRKADWTAALTESERLALAGSSDPRTRGHTGHEHLDRTGLIHRGGRVYDPTLGRFLSPDPLVGSADSAQAWNGYSYVSNSPMSFADPSGLSQVRRGLDFRESLYKLNIVGNYLIVEGRDDLNDMAESSGTMMGFLVKRPPKLSSGAREFVREHPEEARVAVAVALETAAAQSGAESTRSTEDVPARLRQFVVDRAEEDLIGVTEAASRLGVSRTTVYDWVARNTLIAWRSTKRRLNIPAGQIVGPGRVADGLAEVVDVVGEPELAWAFLSEEWPFEDGVARPIERLRSGELGEVLSAAAGFGATFT